MSEVTNEITIAENDQQLAVNADSMDFNIPEGYICTVKRVNEDGTINREGTLRVANALSDADSLADLGDKHFTLVDVLTTPGVRSRTGEVCTNTYLLDSDGNVHMSQPDGIRRSAQQIVGLFNGDFGDGIEVAVVSKKISNGNTLKSLHFFA